MIAIAIAVSCVSFVFAAVAFHTAGRVLRKQMAHYHASTCGDDTHSHRLVWTAGGGVAVICGPPSPDTCGDITHAHLHAQTTNGDAVWICFDEATHRRYKMTLLTRMFGVHNGTPLNVHPPVPTPPEES